MATKKKKNKHKHPPTPPAELMKLAEEQLLRGDAGAAIETLRRVETNLKPYLAPSGDKKISIPPHILAVKDALPTQMARAHFALALKTPDPKDQLLNFTQAASKSPNEARYLLALDAHRVIAGEPAASADIQKARERWPENEIVNRAFAVFVSIDPLSSFLPAQSPLIAMLRSLSKDGDNASAAEVFSAQPALDRNPSRAEAAIIATQFFYNGAGQFNKGRLREAQAAWREAIVAAQKARVRFGWLDRVADGLYAIAARVSQTDPPLAAECWRQILAFLPEDKTANANLAQAQRAEALRAWQNGESERAASLWQDALSAKPNDQYLLRNLAIACEKLNRRDEAIHHWRALARVWRQQAPTRKSETGFKEQLLRLEQHLVKQMIAANLPVNEILNELDSALKLDTDNAELLMLAINQSMEMGNTRQALKHIDVVEKVKGESASLLIVKGTALDMAHRRDEARKALERALALEPANALARRTLVIFLNRDALNAENRKDFVRAMDICREQIGIDPKYEMAYGHLGSIQLDRGLKKEAKETLDQMIEIDPKSARHRVIVGGIYLDHNLKREAAALFKKAVELEPIDICFLSIGHAYLDNDQPKKAIEYYDRAVELGGVDMIVEIAMDLIEADQTKTAMKYFDKAIERDPGHPVPHLAKVISMVQDPISIIIGGPKKMAEIVSAFREVERLAAARPEFADIVPEIHDIIRDFEHSPMGLLGNIGSPFDDYDDEDDDLRIEKERMRKTLNERNTRI